MADADHVLNMESASSSHWRTHGHAGAGSSSNKEAGAGEQWEGGGGGGVGGRLLAASFPLLQLDLYLLDCTELLHASSVQ